MTMPRTLRNMPSKLLFHLWTLFLFTKSDFKTAVMPITLFTLASAPLDSLTYLRVPHIVFWIWLHLLQNAIANQTLNPEEDECNKSYRPLPTKRITLHNALRLRWVLVPACWALSSCYSMQTVYTSIALCILGFVYNEMGYAAGHWFGRNFLNALGFMFLEFGACLIAGANRHSMDKISAFSVFYSAGIVMTTIQAQDFKDTEGDRLVGRKTLPIVAPGVARPTLSLALLAWSRALSSLWDLSAIPALTFYCLALVVGGRFVALKSVKADHRSFYLYCVWFSVAHALPAYSRFVASASAL